ncbi:MAG: hypothetical protein ACMZ64_06655 [Oleiphilus sp.]
MSSQMIRNIFLVLVLIFSSPVNACGFFTGLFTTENASLDYVGAIEFGVPFQKNDFTNIPLSFTGGKWLLNSGIAFKKVKGKLQGNNINITVQTCLASGGSQSQEQQITLKNLVPGDYNVNYINPNGNSVHVGKIKI